MGQHAEDDLNRLLDGWEDGPELHETECRRCGKGGLAWEDDNGRWRLVDGHGEVHRCDPARIAKAISADFEALD